jgi:hypothetical protein
MKYIIIVLICFLVSCSTYTINKEELKLQLVEGKAYHKTYVPVLFSEYSNNGITKILCQNSEGELVYLYPNINTQLEITSKSGDIFKAYFDTVFLNGDKIVGLRSRLVGGIREISFSDIQRIEIYAENPKIEKVSNEKQQIQ